MNRAFINRTQAITFRQWSRKKYAIFSSLGKEVNIGHVDVDICDKAFDKTCNTGTAVFSNIESQKADYDDEDILLSEIMDTQIITLLSVTGNSDISSRPCRNLINNLISCNLTGSFLEGLELLYNLFNYEKKDT